MSAGLTRAAGLLDNGTKLFLAFVGDGDIRKLNATFKSSNRPTNVLSFETCGVDPEDCALTLGEIVVSVDTAKREALRAGMPLRDRLEELVVHGMVHLLGYDHTIGRAESAKMRARERLLLRRLRTRDKRPGKRG